MKHLFLLSTVFLALISTAQKLIVQSGASFIASGAPTLVLNNMSLDATVSATDLQAANLVVSGNNDASLRNSSDILKLQTIIVDKPGATLTLKGDVQVSKGVQMVNGLFDVANKHLYLYGSAVISGETPTARITASSDGYVQAVADFVANTPLNVGGMGVFVTTASDDREVTVRRGHKVQGGSGLSGGIHRYYDFDPPGTGLNATLKFTYFDEELNGQIESGLHLFESSSGSSWSSKPSLNKDAAANYISTSGLNGLHRYTLGGVAGAALPVAGLELQAKRLNAQQVMLTWKTIQENNSAGFAIERQQEDETVFVQRAFVPTKAIGGNSNSLLNYEVIDTNAFEGNTDYRIRQTDANGNVSYSDIKWVEGRGNDATFTIWPVPTTGDVYVRVNSPAKEILHLLDANGQLLKEFAIENGQTYTLANLAPGMYFILCKNKKEKAEKIIVQ